MKLDELRHYKPEIEAVAALYGVSDIRIFGSTVRGESGQDSDVDFLVRIETGRSLFDYMRFRRKVGELLGCAVDVVEESAEVHPIVWQRIIQEAMPL